MRAFAMRGFYLGAATLTTVTVTLSATFAATRAEARPLDPITAVEQRARLNELQPAPWGGKTKEQDDGSAGSCRRSRLTLEINDPITGETKSQSLVIVRPQTTERVPVMLIVPTIKGPTAIESAVQGEFCDMNVASILADVNDTAIPQTMPDWGHEDKTNRMAVLALRTAIDYAANQPSFDSTKIGLIGFSLGGITSAMMAGIEPERLNAIVIVVGGGNMPYILAASENSKISDLRNRRMEHEGFREVGDYENRLRSTLKYDPMYFSSLAKKEKIFMVMSNADVDVPTLVQKDLFAALGQPENTVFNVGHVPTIISLTYFYFDYVTKFVAKRFALPSLLAANPLVEQHRAERRRQIPEALRQLTSP